MSISMTQAHNLIEQVKQQEIALGRAPETWYTYENHVFGVGKIAQLIASEIPAMNAERLYIMGLLHDVCRTEQDRKNRFHGVLGYEKLLADDPEVARICLLHTFPWNKLPPYEKYPDLYYHHKEDYDFIAQYMADHPATDEDYLIQLCDNLANKDGFVTLEQRARDYGARHPTANLDPILIDSNEIKQYFEKKIGHDIYDFYKTNQI
ncbi:MAG: HD domain-containing protein [Alphaproteobacteria bacterium]|nr:HD domain-containing protein [Alphaproteobacteria bacterium]